MVPGQTFVTPGKAAPSRDSCPVATARRDANVPSGESVESSSQGSGKRPQKPGGDSESVVAGTGLTPGPDQDGGLHGWRGAGLQERPEPVRTERIRGSPDRLSSEPA